eukprot:UN06913
MSQCKNCICQEENRKSFNILTCNKNPSSNDCSNCIVKKTCTSERVPLLNVTNKENNNYTNLNNFKNNRTDSKENKNFITRLFSSGNVSNMTSKNSMTNNNHLSHRESTSINNIENTNALLSNRENEDDDFGAVSVGNNSNGGISRKNYYFGLFLVFITAVCWVVSSTLTNNIFTGSDFNQPFF